MARFKNKDIFFKDYDMAIFGTDQDSTLFWDGAEEDLRLTTVISGVYPTEDGHLTTKYYVDQGDIDDFLELTDTPSTYTGSSLKLVRVNVGETGLYFDDINSIASGTLLHSNLIGLDADDHPTYVPRDGSRGFTSTVSGVYPTEDYHLTTKDYVDNVYPSAESIIFGLQFHANAYAGEQQTNSLAYLEALSLTVSGTDGGGVDEGYYRIGWTFEWRQDRLNYNFKVRVRLDDSITVYTLIASPFVDVNYYILNTGFYYTGLLSSGVHNIDLDFSTSDTKATSFIKNVRLDIWRVG